MKHLTAKIFLLVALILFGIMGFNYFQRLAVQSHSTVADGIVLKNQRHLSIDMGNDVFAPVVKFQTPTGQDFQFESAMQTSPPDFKVGDHVKVYYDPEHPENAQVFSPITISLDFWILGGIGLIFLVIGIYSWRTNDDD